MIYLRLLPLFLLVPAMLQCADTTLPNNTANQAGGSVDTTSPNIPFFTVRARLINYNGQFDLPSNKKSPDIVVDAVHATLSKYPIAELRVNESFTCKDIRNRFAHALEQPTETTRLYAGTCDRSLFQFSIAQMKASKAEVLLNQLEGKYIDSNSGALVIINCPPKIDN